MTLPEVRPAVAVDLERRAGEVALAVRLGQQRLGRRRLVQGLGPGSGLGVVVGQQVRVEGRVRPHGEHRPGARVERHHRPPTVTEGVAGGLLEVLAHRQHHVTLARGVGEEARQPVQLERRCPPRQLLVVGALHTVGAQRERVVAGHGGEQLAVGVHPLVAQRGPSLLGGCGGLAVRGEDVAAGLVEVALELAGVVGAVAVGLRLQDLDLVELGEHGDVADDHDHAERLDLTVHRRTPLTSPPPAPGRDAPSGPRSEPGAPAARSWPPGSCRRRRRTAGSPR